MDRTVHVALHKKWQAVLRLSCDSGNSSTALSDENDSVSIQ
jgi:hypothetical protein